jgi:hypothetical protein
MPICSLVRNAPAIHHPAGANERESSPESAPSQEDTMRNFTSIIVSVILAAGISGMFFTATLV